MKIEVTHDDGSVEDVTELVLHAYECLWEGTRWHKDWDVGDVAKFADLAQAMRHSTAATARKVAVDLRKEEAEAREAEEEWYRKNGAGAKLFAPTRA